VLVIASKYAVVQVNEGMAKLAKGEAHYRIVLTLDDEAAM